jgi:hypothetical protein
MPSRRVRRNGKGPVPRFSSRLIPVPTLAVLLLCACDTFPAQQAIGASLAPDGHQKSSTYVAPEKRLNGSKSSDRSTTQVEATTWFCGPSRGQLRGRSHSSRSWSALPPRRIRRIRSPSPRASLDPPTCRDRDDGQSFGGRGSFPRGKPSYRQDPYLQWSVRFTLRFSSVGSIEVQYVNTRLVLHFAYWLLDCQSYTRLPRR